LGRFTSEDEKIRQVSQEKTGPAGENQILALAGM